MCHLFLPFFIRYKKIFSIIVLFVLPVSNVLALNLKQAEQLAVRADPSIENLKATSRSFEEASIADDTLPDPKLRLGASNVPVDTFALDQENMTQLKLGVQQYFPAGDTLAIKSQQSKFLSSSALALADDVKLKILRDVRETFLNLHYETSAYLIITETKKLFSDLVTITESIYASGRASASQQDVVLANLELARLDDRLTKIQAREEGFRATLAQWIGEPAWGSINKEFPELPRLPALPEDIDLNRVIPQHPLIRSENARIDASKQLVEIAKQEYKPSYSATLDYGYRSGSSVNSTSTNSNDRADFLTAMVSMDIPLFTKNRQDKRVSSNVQKTAAAKNSKDDKLRLLKQYFKKNQYLWQRLGEREELYKKSLLTSARNNTATALTAYQSGIAEFNTLMRAEITELDVRLDDLRIRVDRAAAQARLLYITGDTNGQTDGVTNNETK